MPVSCLSCLRIDSSHNAKMPGNDSKNYSHCLTTRRFVASIVKKFANSAEFIVAQHLTWQSRALNRATRVW